MKTQIRRNIFETNSSSVHAITITNKKVNGDLAKYISCEFTVRNFGWEHVTYYDFNAKASYLWTIIVNAFLKRVDDDETETWHDGTVHQKYHYELDKENEEYIKIKDTIRKALVNFGVEDDRWNIRFQEDFEKTSWGSLETGYVDHDPGLGFVYEIINDEDRLIRFLFSDNSKITTWNDNEWHYDGEDDDTDDSYEDTVDWDNEESVNKWYEWHRKQDWKYFGGIPADSEWNYIKDN